MKIFSKFQDYYDSALGSFLDSDVAVYRKTSTINIPYKEIPRLGNYDFSYEVVKDINGRKQYGKLPVHMIGFCGTWYFFVYAQDRRGFFNKLEYKTFDEIVENNRQNSFFYGYNSNKGVTDPNKEPGWKEIFEKYGPVLYIDKYDPPGKYYRQFSNINMETVIWPELKAYKFQAIKDPYTALWEIEHWFDTHARPDEAVVPVGDDITRLQAHGFDKKTSFRKGKEK